MLHDFINIVACGNRRRDLKWIDDVNIFISSSGQVDAVEQPQVPAPMIKIDDFGVNTGGVILV